MAGLCLHSLGFLPDLLVVFVFGGAHPFWGLRVPGLCDWYAVWVFTGGSTVGITARFPCSCVSVRARHPSRLCFVPALLLAVILLPRYFRFLISSVVCVSLSCFRTVLGSFLFARACGRGATWCFTRRVVELVWSIRGCLAPLASVLASVYVFTSFVISFVFGD